MAARRAKSVVSVVSARPDGATTVAAALAAHWSAAERALLIDLNLERPEIAPLLDVGATKTIYHLAFNAQLAPVAADDLEEDLAWHEGLAVLSGVSRPNQGSAVSDHFVGALVEQAAQRFDRIVIDLGRLRPQMLPALESDELLLLVVPGPLGLAAVEAASLDHKDAGVTWPNSLKVVLNRCGPRDFIGVDRFLSVEYGLEVIGQVPDVPAYAKSVELSHSLRALSVPAGDDRTFIRRYGPEALALRQGIESLSAALERAEPLRVAGGS